MAIKMRRGKFDDLDTTRLVGGELAITDDPEKVIVKTNDGEVVTLATQDDLQNIIMVDGGVTINDNTLIITPEDSSATQQGSPVDIDKISIDGGETLNPIKDSTARTNITSVSGRVTAIENSVGANNGIAPLDSTGRVPSSNLPSYVDDVIEGYYKVADGKFYKESTYTTEITPESGKIYVSIDTNKEYRWGGSTYVEIASALALGETQGTAYEGSKGKANADNIADIQSVIPSKASTSNMLATMEDVGGSGGDAVWGGITGSLNDQTDLKAALDKKCGVDDLLYQFDESADIPFYMVSEPKTRKVTFTDFRKKITSSFYDFVRKTVGFTTKNIADTSKAEIGVNGAGTANSKRARLIVPCEGSTSYRVTSSGTNNFTQIDYMTTDTLPPSGGYSGISFPATITTNASDKYIVFVFKKSTDVTQSDVDALKMMVKESSVTDDTYEPYHASVDVAKANRQEIKDTVGWIGKNILHITTETITKNGVTFTVSRNSNGEVISIVANGTATADTYVTLNYDIKIPKAGNYIISGCPSGGAGATYNIIFREDPYVSGGIIVYDKGDGGNVYISDLSKKYTAIISVMNGVTVTNKTFYPMLRDASIADSTFEPYHKSVDVAKANRDEVKDVIGWSGKNIFDSLAFDKVKEVNTNGTWSGNTFTNNGIDYTCEVNEDGVITAVTVNGTATGNAVIQLLKVRKGEDYKAKGNAIIMSGCPANGSEQTYYLNAYRMGTVDGSTGTFVDKGNGVEFTPLNDGSGSVAGNIAIVIMSGYTASNLVFKPMLRKADIADDTYEPYHASVEQTLRDAEVVEGKNKLHIPESVISRTSNGITFTVYRNNEGELEYVNVNGTATATEFFDVIPLGAFPQSLYDAGEVLLSGCPSGAEITVRATSSVTSLLYKNVYATTANADSNGDFTLDFSKLILENTQNYASRDSLRLAIRVGNGGTVNNLKVTPMVRSKSESDRTFEPYYIPLKDSKFDRSEQNVLGAKNFVSGQSSATLVKSSTRTIRIPTSRLCEIEKKYIVSFNIDSMSNFDSSRTEHFGIRLQTQTTNQDSSNTFLVNDIRTGLVEGEVTVTRDATTRNLVIYFFINNGEPDDATITISNIMLRLASDPDTTYAPYAMTNRELTEAIQHGGGGGGDMYIADYDNHQIVKNAGGIDSYVSTAISGKADSSDLDSYTASVTQLNGKATFDNLDPSYGYDLCYDDDGATGNVTVPTWAGTYTKSNGTNTGTIKLAYDVNGTDGTSKWALRILK